MKKRAKCSCSLKPFRIAIGADHGGFVIKAHLIKAMQTLGLEVADLGTHSKEPCDYPLIARKVAEAVSCGKFDKGVLLCKSGIGISIAANKVPGIRAANCRDTFEAKRSREHNDANILVLGAERISLKKAIQLLQIFIATGFERGTRHERRVKQINAIERNFSRRPRA